MKTYIYILIDPETNLVRYVGKTTNIKRRYSQHIYEAKRIKTHKNNWLKYLLDKKLKPEILVIDEIEENEWTQLEQWYIEYYRFLGYILTNGTLGGDGIIGHKHSDYTKSLMSKIHKDKVLSDETKQKISEANIGRIGPMAGKSHTDVAKKKISEKLKGKTK
jgi:group I intron endonuclease